MTGIYMMLMNLPPYLRSKIDNVELIMMCKKSTMKKHGWKKVLHFDGMELDLIHDTLEDLKRLEVDGIEVIINNESFKFKGSLIAGVGDNLGQHEIAEMSPESYRECALEAERTGTMVKGVRSLSCYDSSLHHVKVCGPGLPSCIDHDLFGGIVPKDMYLMITYFVRKRWFKYGLLNYRLNDFKFDYDPSICIPEIEANRSKKLVDTSSQMRRLMIIFPVAMEDHVKNEEDPVWKMLLVLRDVCCYANAPGCSNEQLCVFRDHLTEYLELRLELFKNIPILRKHEFLMHLVQQIYHFGPMESLYTRRFESKHKYFKRIIAILQNFKNVPLFLAKKHELYQCSFTNQFASLAEAPKKVEYNPETMIALKVWSCDRSIKRAVLISRELTTWTVLKEATKKLGYHGVQLVLEGDGTVIDDDQILQYFKDQIFISLKDAEEWSPPIYRSPTASSTMTDSPPYSPISVEKDS
ncbi:hypothetical protein QAD02_008070 [Eretmocerus hayati]|uniref:Uncharacterized protein n=1 Tax=Eretmocerus hayati TaxID=131215 RepID=A0ACC2N6R3_9HYME|nr:hypothetical protein QAD02_008070 [Eretmocerus hayati]